MKAVLRFVLPILIWQSFALGQAGYSSLRWNNDALSLAVGIFLKMDSLENSIRVTPEIPREERTILRQKLKYPLMIMGASIIGAFYYQHQADKAYERYQEYYFFPEKSSRIRKRVEKFDDISLGFYLTFEASVFWTFYELIRLE